jgi:glycerol-3-phosphate dehydrogenase (NAD(P)+)
VSRVAVIGAGAWGTALAQIAARAGRAAIVWAHEPDVAAAITRGHENSIFLPGVALAPEIAATSDLAAALQGADIALLAVPAQHLRAITARMRAHLAPGTPLVICAKGVELNSGKLMSEVVAETCPGAPIAILSGPTFAGEVARGLPTAVTLAAADPALGERLVALIGTTHFRPYRSEDVIGAQIGGAVKNVIAVACGIVAGRKLGDNARAALMTRGLAEMMRLGMALGGQRETLMGLSGLGDLALTCNNAQSRNMSLGIALGQGQTQAQALAGKRSVAEGEASAASIAALAARLKVEMPIVAMVDAILHRGADIDAAMKALLARPFKDEI